MSVLFSKYHKLFIFILYINLGIILTEEDKCKTIEHCKKCPDENKCDKCETGFKLNDEHNKCIEKKKKIIIIRK